MTSIYEKYWVFYMVTQYEFIVPFGLYKAKMPRTCDSLRVPIIFHREIYNQILRNL